MWSKRPILYVCLLTGLAMAFAMAGPSAGENASTAAEAPSGYDNQPNGLTDPPSFAMDRGQFEQTEFIGDGLGPIFNAQSCRECHQNPVTGSTSQVKELRAGHQDAFGTLSPPQPPLPMGPARSRTGPSFTHGLSVPAGTHYPATCQHRS